MDRHDKHQQTVTIFSKQTHGIPGPLFILNTQHVNREHEAKSEKVSILSSPSMSPLLELVQLVVADLSIPLAPIR